MIKTKVLLYFLFLYESFVIQVNSKANLCQILNSGEIYQSNTFNNCFFKKHLTVPVPGVDIIKITDSRKINL